MRLRRVVLGYQDASSDFKFDLSLNYRLSGVIHCYSDQKPTLVVRPLEACSNTALYFCSGMVSLSFLVVLCHSQRDPASCKHSGERCTFCDELRTQAEVGKCTMTPIPLTTCFPISPLTSTPGCSGLLTLSEIANLEVCSLLT